MLKDLFLVLRVDLQKDYDSSELRQDSGSCHACEHEWQHEDVLVVSIFHLLFLQARKYGKV